MTSSFGTDLSMQQRRCAQLLLLLISGSVLGAVAANRFLCIHSSLYDLSALFSLAGGVRLIRVLLLSVLGFGLLFAACLSGHFWIVHVLFFWRGLATGYHLWLVGFLFRLGGRVWPGMVLLFSQAPILFCWLITASHLLQDASSRAASPRFCLLLCLAAVLLSAALRLLL